MGYTRDLPVFIESHVRIVDRVTILRKRVDDDLIDSTISPIQDSRATVVDDLYSSLGVFLAPNRSENAIEHRLTKVKHPWTNGQVERMNRTIKEATVKRFYYETHSQLRQHLADFIDAYNFARRLKTLRGLTPYEHISQCWTNEPQRFNVNPIHQMPGLNT